MFVEGSNITIQRDPDNSRITISASGDISATDTEARRLANEALAGLPGKLNLTGGTMTGSLILQSDPQTCLLYTSPSPRDS